MSTMPSICKQAFIAMALGCAGLLTACQGPIDDGLVFDGMRAYELAADQLEFGARHPGSAGHEQVGDWILRQLNEAGWEALEQPFTYDDQQLRNIIGKAGAADGGVIILGAHYDTRSIADVDPIHPTEPVPGANDGASGVAVLLELARVLTAENLCGQVWLVFFDAEDSGNLDGWDWAVGSRYFVELMEIIPQAVVVVDMVGDADLQLYYEHNSDVPLSQEIWELAEQLGYEAFIPELRHAMTDDHTAFMERGIPAVDIIDFDYPYWHTTMDTLDQIASDSLEQVGRTLEMWVESCP